MKPGRRFAPWLFVAGAVVFLVAGLGFGSLGDLGWRVAVAVGAAGATWAGVRVNHMHWAFGLAVGIGGLRVLFLGTDPPDPSSARIVAAGIANGVVGIALLVVLALAVRVRRGRLDVSDGIDVMTVSIGAALSTWIVITSRMIFVDGWNPGVAAIDSSYLPLATLLFVFVVDLLLTGLTSNRSMQFIALAAGMNLLGSAMVSFDTAGMAIPSTDATTATFGAAFMFLCAGLAHPGATGTIMPDQDGDPAVAYTPFRLLLTGACLVVPGILVASLAPYGAADSAIRAAAMLLLVCTVVARLYIAVRNHERANRILVERLHRDELTNLPTRFAFLREVSRVLDTTWRSEYQPTVIQLNLDRFKNINDSLGHEEANRVLIAVGQRLSEATASFGGMVGRAGGDDFMIIDATTTTPDDATDRVEAVRAALRDPLRVGDATVFMTASFGVATAPRDRTITAEELMRRADIAAHRAKGAGRSTVAVFDDSMQAHLAHRMDVEHSLHGAIGRNEMRLYHQPIVDVASGAVCGFESLLRWQRGATIVPPGEFIPIAEDTGIICELGEWALHEALGDLRGWIDDGVVGETTTISVNVSPRQIADPAFAGIVQRALGATGVAPHLLWLEMTESMMLEEPELAGRTLQEIRDMGVGLALDDFGTGYSSLSLLQQFPIQRLKIDRAFVNGIADHGNDRSLVRTVIAMARSMDLDLVAEGVETVHQLQVLGELTCDKAQGFLISHPVPPEAMRSTMVALDELAALSIFGHRTGRATPRGDQDPAAPHVRAVAETERRSVAGLSVGVGGPTSRPFGQPVP